MATYRERNTDVPTLQLSPHAVPTAPYHLETTSPLVSGTSTTCYVTRTQLVHICSRKTRSLSWRECKDPGRG